MFGDAEAYEHFMGRWSNRLAPLLVEFAGLPPQGSVLDAGSGTGALAFAVARRNRRLHVLGIDPSKEYVAYARRKNPFGGRVDFMEGDAQQLRIPDSSFDSALSLLVFNFIPDAKKALAELCRVLKPGATLSAAVWDYGDGMRMLRTFWDAVVALDPVADRFDERHMPLCRSGELAALWRQGGLEDVREQALHIDLHFDSFADYWDPFFLGQGPAGAYIRNLDSKHQQALREELRRRLPSSRDNATLVLGARAWSARGIVSHQR